MSNENKNRLAVSIARQLLIIFDSLKKEIHALRTSFRNAAIEPDAAWADAPWAIIYETPMESFGTELLDAVGMTDKIRCALTNGNAIDALASVQDAIATSEINQADLRDEKGVIGSAAMVFGSSVESLGAFGATMDELIARARGGDDLPLFQAIYIDRSVITGPTAAQRIQKAELSGDERFFDKLSRTLKHSHPPRPEPKNDRARFVLEIFRRWLPQLEITKAELDLIVVNELKAYGTDKDDALEGFTALRKRFIRKRVKDTK